MKSGVPAPPRRRDSARGNGIAAGLRELALSGLPDIFLSDEGLYAFRLQRTPSGTRLEGTSHRYTAIAAIGLATETASTAATGWASSSGLCARLTRDMDALTNVGDVALTLWACAAAGHGDRDAARARLLRMRPDERPLPTVEVAWALAALCVDSNAATTETRARIASRLGGSLSPSAVFPHALGEGGGLRAHISCFADMVYPIQALALHHRLSGDEPGLAAASKAADLICRLQGPAGQWWWHYDYRSGRVVEPYPVYSVHQDAMAPMALFALQEASGRDFTEPIDRGLDWLRASPELGGRSLVDHDTGVIWRKVARREPGKLSRYLQATASVAHPGLRFPATDILFPPRVIDYETRPYHLGWLLHAFPAGRAVGH